MESDSDDGEEVDLEKLMQTGAKAAKGAPNAKPGVHKVGPALTSIIKKDQQKDEGKKKRNRKRNKKNK